MNGSQMARIRTIKPDFWTDEKLTECSLSARLLFIGTWNFADDNGNLDRSHKQIKARVFPLDNIECEPLLNELIAQGLLTEYAVEGKLYLHIQGFTKHQLINRPSKPTCPDYNDSLNTHGVLITEGKGVEGKEGNKAPKKSSAVDLPFPDFVPIELWNDFLAIRKSIKASNSVPAIKALITELIKLRDAGNDPVAVINQSIRSSWKDIYAVKSGNGFSGKGGVSTAMDDNTLLAKAKELGIDTYKQSKNDLVSKINAKLGIK
jgi:hypothetical protein